MLWLRPVERPKWIKNKIFLWKCLTKNDENILPFLSFFCDSSYPWGLKAQIKTTKLWHMWRTFYSNLFLDAVNNKSNELRITNENEREEEYGFLTPPLMNVILLYLPYLVCYSLYKIFDIFGFRYNNFCFKVIP